MPTNKNNSQIISPPWIKSSIVGFLLPVVLIFFLVGAFEYSFMLISPAFSFGLHSGPLVSIVSGILITIPYAIVMLGLAFILSLMFKSWDVPGAYITALNTMLSVAALGAIAVAISKNFFLSLVLLSLAGALVTLVHIWISYKDRSHLKTRIQIIAGVLAIGIIYTGIHIFLQSNDFKL